MGSLAENGGRKPAGIDFLDFIFTVAFSFGLTPEILNIRDFKGLLSEGWVAGGRLPTCAELFAALTLGLGFLTLALSWFGYHASSISRPLKYETIWGMFRFLLDIVLVALYAVIMLQFRRLGVVLALLALVYGLYYVWDLLKIGEYWVVYRNGEGSVLGPFRRELITLIHFGGLLLTWRLSCGSPGWPSLCCAIGLTISYRVTKSWPKFEWVFGVKHAE
jgi:hypothetical protein